MTAQIFISDTHFGVRNNSITWLNSQLSFLENTVYNLIKTLKSKHDKVTLVHLGDVFESRSSLSPLIVYSFNNILNKLSNVATEVIIVGGNHDYYSPNEDSYNITSLDFLHTADNVTILKQEPLSIDSNIFMPWYTFNNYDNFKKYYHNERNIFTHTDVNALSQHYTNLIGTNNIITGHIHTPEFKQNRYTLGSCYSLTFTDANQERGVYVTQDWDMSTMKFIANKDSIRHYRLYSEEVINTNIEFNKNDMLEVYISQEQFSKKKFKDAVKELNEACNCVTRFISEQDAQIDSVNIQELNIEEICKKNVPEHLKSKFESIL